MEARIIKCQKISRIIKNTQENNIRAKTQKAKGWSTKKINIKKHVEVIKKNPIS